jgi:uncharacterized protein (TIRG00374 family)
VGLAVSAIALFLVVRSVDLSAAWSTLRTAQPQWVLLLVTFIVADVFIRAVRWRVLLGPLTRGRPLRTTTTAASLLVGYLANNVLPARLGEVVRAHDLGGRTTLSRSAILGTIVVERVVDTMVVVAIAAVAILVLSVRGIVASAVLVGLALTSLLVVGIVAGIAAHRLPGAARFGAILARWPRVRGALTRLREGLAVASDLRAVGGAVLLTVACWSSTVFAFAAAAQAVGVQPTMGQAALLAAGINLATAIPAGPGYIGTFELAAVTIATSVGIDREAALAFALLVHATTLLLTSAGGAIVLIAGGSRERATVRHAVASSARRVLDAPDAGTEP